MCSFTIRSCEHCLPRTCGAPGGKQRATWRRGCPPQERSVTPWGQTGATRQQELGERFAFLDNDIDSPKVKAGEWNMAGGSLKLVHEAGPARHSEFEPKKLQRLPKNTSPESMSSGPDAEAGVGRSLSPQC